MKWSKKARMLAQGGVLLAAIGGGTQSSLAQDDSPEQGGLRELVSGPQKGTSLTPIRVFAPAGTQAGKEFDVAALVGEGPGAVLFVHEITRNIAPVIRGLDRLGQEFALAGFQAFAVVLNGDRTQAETRLKAVNRSLRLASPLLLSLDGAEGPGNYALNRRCMLTLVTTRDGKVHRAVGLTDVGRTDAAFLRDAVEEVAGKIPADPEEFRAWLNERLPQDAALLRQMLSQQATANLRLRREIDRLQEQLEQRPRTGARSASTMRRGDRDSGPARSERPAQDPPATEGEKTERKGKPPEDAELQGLLRSFIRKTNSDEQVDEIYTAILARGDSDESLQVQVTLMMQLIVSYGDHYGTPHARARAAGLLEARNSDKEKKGDHQKKGEKRATRTATGRIW